MGEEQHARDAEQKLETAEIDMVRTDRVLDTWQATMAENEKIIRRNGFGEALTRIWRAPVRKGA